MYHKFFIHLQFRGSEAPGALDSSTTTTTPSPTTSPTPPPTPGPTLSIMSSPTPDPVCGAAVGVDSCAQVSGLWTDSRPWNTVPPAEKLVFCRQHYLRSTSPGVGRPYEYGDPDASMSLCWFLNDEEQCDSLGGMCQCSNSTGFEPTLGRYIHPACPGYMMLYPTVMTPSPTPASFVEL